MSAKDEILDAIIGSTVPDKWFNETDASYTFNEVTVTARFDFTVSPATVEILKWKDNSGTTPSAHDVTNMLKRNFTQIP